jgi:hypothetical protein
LPQNETILETESEAMTSHDHLLPAAKRLIRSLAGKPGNHFASQEMAADFLAQSLARMIERGDLRAEDKAKK